MREQPTGNDPSFNKAYEELFYPLTYFATKLLNNQVDAEDVVADVLLKFLQLNKEFVSEDERRRYLYTMIKNRCYDLLRKQRKHSQVLERLGQNESTVENEVQNLFIKTELLESIYQEIERLPDKRREVFKLFYLEDLKIEEIAQRLGTNADVIRSTKSKALAQLKMMLGDKKFLLLMTCLLSKAVGHPSNY
jgi:RNA polymerase sigma-70 factor (ECF subfamily)